MSATNWKKELVLAMAQKILNCGYRVFLAESGTYGFFTDSKGSKLISFQNNFLHVTFTGNYKSTNARQCGTGWRIDGEYHPDISCYQIDRIFNSCVPAWAHQGHAYTLTTLEHHLKRYQSSSKYTELKREICIQPVNQFNDCK